MPKAKASTTPQRVSSPQENESYIKFLRGLQLVGLGLKNTTATLNRDVFFELVQAEQKPVRRFSESYSVSEIGTGYLEAEGRYDVKISSGDKVGLEIQCVFEVHMHTEGTIEKALAERFAKTDLRFVLLPYARQFVTSVTAEMQIPPVVLPLAAAKGQARPEAHKD